MLRYPLESSEAAPRDTNNPAIQIYGNRVHLGQTLYEYLLEFLLVFASAKDDKGGGKLAFHEGPPVRYYVEPRTGLRRFIFYEYAYKEKVIPEDAEAYTRIQEILKSRISGDDDARKTQFIQAVQDLFRGYAAVLKKRPWYAQSLLPLCTEMIFCEQVAGKDSGNVEALRQQYADSDKYNQYDPVASYHDSKFDCNRHDYFCRGGELYYLHLLQALEQDPEGRLDLERKLQHLLTDRGQKFAQLANWIEDSWVEEAQIAPDRLVVRKSMGYLPAGAYLEEGRLSVLELRCFLKSALHPVQRIELLTQGVMLQILRMLSARACQYTVRPRTPWILDMRAPHRDPTIRQLSMQSYQRLNEIFAEAINHCLNDRYGSIDEKEGYLVPEKAPASSDLADLQMSTVSDTAKNRHKDYIKGREASADLFRARGKDIQLIFPNTGGNERFTLSEPVGRFLVLSLLAPGEKMALDSFLAALYEHYGMVIGPAEYLACQDERHLPRTLAEAFHHNQAAFGAFLQSIGCLRALSDATSIVQNPYQEVEMS